MEFIHMELLNHTVAVEETYSLSVSGHCDLECRNCKGYIIMLWGIVNVTEDPNPVIQTQWMGRETQSAYPGHMAKWST